MCQAAVAVVTNLLASVKDKYIQCADNNDSDENNDEVQYSEVDMLVITKCFVVVVLYL